MKEKREERRGRKEEMSQEKTALPEMRMKTERISVRDIVLRAPPVQGPLPKEGEM